MSTLFTSNSPAVPPPGYADVALEQAIDIAPGGLSYAIPPELFPLEIGQRVLVPLGRKNKPVPGYVMALRTSCPYDRVKTILGLDPMGLALTPDLLELSRWIASYYCSPTGMVLSSMLPAAVKHGTGTTLQLCVRLAEPVAAEEGDGEQGTGTSAETPEKKPPRLSPLQQKILALLKERTTSDDPWLPARLLADAAGARTAAPVKGLVARGLLLGRRQTVLEALASAHEFEDALDPMDDEAAAAQPPAAGADPAATAPPPAPAPPSDVVTAEESPLEAAVQGYFPADDTQVRTLSDDQQRAVDNIAASFSRGFSVHLLHGVTGSGKTEVYLQLIERCGKGAIVLVPEIALTPQTVARFVARYPGAVAVLHSGLSAGQRHQQWRQIRGGDARIVIGARSAVFAPLPAEKIGLIIVDEEHEASYKQDQVPRYHGRDVAIKRAQLLNVPVVLGSATPSLESYYNAALHPERAGKQFHLAELPQRVTGLKLPVVHLVDMVVERRRRRGIHLLSGLLEDLLGHTLRTGGQALLLLNRRGYANYIACPDHNCAWQLLCEHCDALMVYHKDHQLPRGGVVRCHHCAAEQLLPQLCPVCSKKVTVFGLGTQRVEEELLRKFPELVNYGLARMDSDSMRSGRDYYRTLERFRRGQLRLLVGTQMIAKGLDFPNVRLVGVISGDTCLNMPDFRASERTFQLIAQVAGRAGRGDKPGIVVVQSVSPQDPAIVLASRHDYPAFAQRELAIRKEMGLPPLTRMARIVVRDLDPAVCVQRAAQFAHHLELFNRQLFGGSSGLRLRGPAPCPIARIAGYHRQQIELITPTPAANAAGRSGASPASSGPAMLQKLLTALRNARLLQADQLTAVDVDPVALL